MAISLNSRSRNVNPTNNDSGNSHAPGARGKANRWTSARHKKRTGGTMIDIATRIARRRPTRGSNRAMRGIGTPVVTSLFGTLYSASPSLRRMHEIASPRRSPNSLGFCDVSGDEEGYHRRSVGRVGARTAAPKHVSSANCRRPACIFAQPQTAPAGHRPWTRTLSPRRR